MCELIKKYIMITFFFIISNTVISFWSIFETPFSRSGTNRHIKTDIDLQIPIYIDRFTSKELHLFNLILLVKFFY